jgi:DNA topoisomerase III
MNLLDYNGYEPPRNGTKDDKAHPPIHPVKSMTRQQAESDLEYKIYELIARHFLACCSKSAVGNETNI